MSTTSTTSNDKKDDVGDILLSLPQCDMERPDGDANNSGSTGTGTGTGIVNTKIKKSMKTTAKRADFVLFQLPKNNKRTSRTGTSTKTSY